MEFMHGKTLAEMIGEVCEFDRPFRQPFKPPAIVEVQRTPRPWTPQPHAACSRRKAIGQVLDAVCPTAAHLVLRDPRNPSRRNKTSRRVNRRPAASQLPGAEQVRGSPATPGATSFPWGLGFTNSLWEFLFRVGRGPRWTGRFWTGTFG